MSAIPPYCFDSRAKDRLRAVLHSFRFVEPNED